MRDKYWPNPRITVEAAVSHDGEDERDSAPRGCAESHGRAASACSQEWLGRCVEGVSGWTVCGQCAVWTVGRQCSVDSVRTVLSYSSFVFDAG